MAVSAEFRRFLPGLCAIAVVGLPVAWTSFGADSPFSTAQLAGFWAAVVVFTVVLYGLVVRQPGARIAHGLIGLASALALFANWLIPMCLPGVALTGILLAVAAATFERLPRAFAAGLIVVQTGLLFAIYTTGHGWPVGTAASAAGGYGLMQFVLESTWRLASLERARRVELEGAVRELRSTQAMLTETVRAAQRAEIARNLHDVVGHHLVALGLQLDAALASTAAPAQARLAESRQLVRAVLTSVREVVAGLQDHDVVELATALGSLASEGPGPRVVVRIDERAPRMPVELAELLMRCAQEALTNARKHAFARQVVITLGPDRLEIADDGRGIGSALPGFGLQSMRSRCAALGCELAIRSSTAGTTLSIRWPDEARP